MSDGLLEMGLIAQVVEGLPRSPAQRNGTHLADAEIVDLPGGTRLAVTIDGLHEEVQVGLLRDPEAIGWAMVAHALSDVAAVAAEPIGVLLSHTLPADASEQWIAGLTRGVGKALSHHGTFCLGGDTSTSTEPSFHCVGLGVLPGGKYLDRTGIQPGDHLFLTGPVGFGNLLGIARRVSEEVRAGFEAGYRPKARFAHARVARDLARACIDTSDGFLAAVDMLMRLNGVGARLTLGEQHYQPELVALSKQADFPLWIGGAFGMGEYELLLAVPPERVEEFRAGLAAADLSAAEVGRVLAEPVMVMDLYGAPRRVDSTYLMNLFPRSGSVDAYVEGLLGYDRELRAAPEVSVS